MTEPNFDHDRPDPLEPQEWEYATVMPDGTTVLISKVGGGTLGQSYDGYWHYSVSRQDWHMEGSDLRTGGPADHYWVAEFVYTYSIEENT